MFNQHRLLGEKKSDTWIYENKGMQRTSKIALNSEFKPAEACGLQDDVILVCLASSTTPRPRNLLVALAQYTLTHVDKAVVVVLKFPNIQSRSTDWPF